MRTLDFGIELMDTAFDLPATSHWKRYLQYRDGLIIAFLSLWPIRRRSIAALTVDRHLDFDDAGVIVLLGAADTKSKRDESCRLPLGAGSLRPAVSRRGPPPASQRSTFTTGFGLPGRVARSQVEGSTIPSARGSSRGSDKDMCLHDFRRAAATYIAIDMPEKIGLIPGVLQQAGPEVGEQHYNLANAMKASVRYGDTMSNLKADLRAKFLRSKG